MVTVCWQEVDLCNLHIPRSPFFRYFPLSAFVLRVEKVVPASCRVIESSPLGDRLCRQWERGVDLVQQ